MLDYNGYKVYMDGQYPAFYYNGKNNHVHVDQWKKHHGEIPEGYIVHHKDENKLNWDIENLELLSRSEHIKRHKGTVHRKGIPIIARKNNRVLWFDSIEKAATHCGTYTACIHRIFSGKQHAANGWRFERG